MIREKGCQLPHINSGHAAAEGPLGDQCCRQHGRTHLVATVTKVVVERPVTDVDQPAGCHLFYRTRDGLAGTTDLCGQNGKLSILDAAQRCDHGKEIKADAVTGSATKDGADLAVESSSVQDTHIATGLGENDLGKHRRPTDAPRGLAKDLLSKKL